MAAFSLIEMATGKIVNKIAFDENSDWSPPKGFAIEQGEYEIGGTLRGGKYTPPNPTIVPAPLARVEISDRQFFQQLAIAGVITPQEALAAVKTGDIPAVLQGYVDAIEEDDQRFAAEMLLSGATVFERRHPLTAAIGAGQGMTEAEVDAFFVAAAAL